MEKELASKFIVVLMKNFLFFFYFWTTEVQNEIGLYFISCSKLPDIITLYSSPLVHPHNTDFTNFLKHCIEFLTKSLLPYTLRGLSNTIKCGWDESSFTNHWLTGVQVQTMQPAHSVLTVSHVGNHILVSIQIRERIARVATLFVSLTAPARAQVLLMDHVRLIAVAAGDPHTPVEDWVTRN